MQSDMIAALLMIEQVAENHDLDQQLLNQMNVVAENTMMNQSGMMLFEAFSEIHSKPSSSKSAATSEN